MAPSTENFFLLIAPLLLLLLAYTSFLFISGKSPSLKRRRIKPPTPPPGPPALPIIGHLHLVGKVLPTSFQALAQAHGPLLTLRLGLSTCVLASNASTAQQIFKAHELNFSSRPEFGSAQYSIYRGSNFAMAPYGDYWRFMKKLTVTRLLSPARLRLLAGVVDDERLRLLRSVAAGDGKVCDLGSELTAMTNNVICRMAMSTRCSGESEEAERVRRVVAECLDLAGKLSCGDALGPFFSVLDFSGNGPKLFRVLTEFDGLDIFIAGTDTTSTAMQWAMAELINHPAAFKTLRDEINAVVGRPNQLIKSSDVPNLPFLRAVIHETLRLHPPAPLIIRESADDCQVNGFTIKRKTRVLTNVYAVMRDPQCWKNPDEFIPERFMEDSGEKIEGGNFDFRYLPFGSGRRGCPGESLAMMVMHATVGALVQCFDWEVEGGEKLDMSLVVLDRLWLGHEMEEKLDLEKESHHWVAYAAEGSRRLDLLGSPIVVD
ncbi:unnamed protein product [Linum tenue]|uniref:Cytochrome P450 n=1 Tax=Linum tenue TaxID=586396 RepID=A0AAV0JCP6_9ROSI|nr:unnamed protein product [Linum tenue]